MRTPASGAVLGSYLDRLVAGTLAPAVHIDLVDAVQSSGSAALEARLEAYQKARAADTLATAFRPGLITGGDARRGREVYVENVAAQCSRCHSLRGRGADVGPNLSSIGTTLSREQLLEALIDPNARIAPGFGTVSLKLRNGQQVDGTLRDETDTHLAVMTGTLQRIAKTDVADRTNPISAMPPMGLLLKPREIRDLVEFLSTLK
ncbi:MAG: c-type cytochrome [Acidobacteria bacterium]|nr:c-type cytochrome [Acidobacteriota bacterium]